MVFIILKKDGETCLFQEHDEKNGVIAFFLVFIQDTKRIV